MEMALGQCVTNIACAQAVIDITLSSAAFTVHIGFVDSLAGLGVEGCKKKRSGCTEFLVTMPDMRTVTNINVFIESGTAGRPGGSGLVITHELGHIVDSIWWGPSYHQIGEGLVELMTNSFWNDYYCRNAPGRCSR